MKIFVGNLSLEASEAELEALAAPFGEVQAVSIAQDESGAPKGFGFIELATQAEGEALLAGLQGSEFKGQVLKLNEARPQTKAGAKVGSAWKGLGGQGVPGSGQKKVKGSTKGKGGFNQSKGSSSKV